MLQTPRAGSTPRATLQQTADSQALQRAATHTLTTLDVCRRKWAVLSSEGKVALSGCVNAQLKMAHAESGEWPAGFQAVRSGIALCALEQRRESEAAIHPVLEALAALVADMRATSESLCSRVESLTPQHSPLRAAPLLHSESVDQILARVAEVVRTYERELKLRQSVVAELTGGTSGGGEDHGEYQTAPQPRGPGWDASARLLLSAWVLEPFIESEHLELLFDSLAAEPTVSPGRRGR